MLLLRQQSLCTRQLRRILQPQLHARQLPLMRRLHSMRAHLLIQRSNIRRYPHSRRQQLSNRTRLTLRILQLQLHARQLPLMRHPRNTRLLLGLLPLTQLLSRLLR
jgi:hypothetical protein